MSPEPAGIYLRFWLWTAAVAALALLYALRVAPQLRIDTDIMALLPGTGDQTTAAQQRHSDALGRKLLFLVGAADSQRARQAAQQLARRLRDAHVFTAVNLETDAAAADLALYREHRFSLLSDAQRTLLSHGGAEQLRAQTLAGLYGPGVTPRALPVAQDPFNLLGDFLGQQLAGLGAVRPDHGMLMLTEAGISYVLVGAEIGGDPFAVDTQNRIMPVMEAAVAQVRGAGAQVLSTGVILHATQAARRARNEINLVGTLSMVGVALMILLTFRSLRPLLLNIVVLGSGALAALTLCQLIFGRVTLMALVFGTGLIGVAADYSTHFLADQFRNRADWTPRQALRHVGPSIAMGMGCAVLGYLSLGLTPLPGLRQMAVFSATGLVVACCGVLCWFPVLAPPARRGEPLPLRWAVNLDRHLGRFGGRHTRAAIWTLAVLALLGVARIDFADDVHLLYAVPAPLREADNRVRTLLHSVPDSQFFLVQGRSPEAVLQAEERLREGLDALVTRGGLDAYRAVTRGLPSAQRQQKNHALLATQIYGPDGIGPRLMDELGFPPALTAQRLAEFAAAPPPLGVEQWLADAASIPYRDLWLGVDAKGYASIVSLSGIRDFTALRALPDHLPGVQFVDRVAAVSELLGHYRRLALLLLATAYVLIGGAMALRYGAADAARLLAAPLGAALLTAAALGACGALNLFHVLGLFVVLGLGVDYAVFLREGAASRAATVLAISLSTVGAALSYGLLAFSATPFIRAIGLTLLIGVGFTYLLALLLQPPPSGAIHAEVS
ncbi:MAG: MMPL family transporter [Immundisolibacter sp.]|uniref:MMPL family transporter n=1 Tax=Immundisolibacter sp. TaxID=1934948 RepID=UPI003EDEAC0C